MNRKYSLVIEATDDPNFFGIYSPELSGFTGVGNSVEDCLAQSEPAMEEYVSFLIEEGLPVPPLNPNPAVTAQRNDRIIPAA